MRDTAVGVLMYIVMVQVKCIFVHEGVYGEQNKSSTHF